MSYINKKNEPLVNVKLTDTGRRNLASGKLTFSKFSLGDSELDYRTVNSDNNFTLQNILRPADNQQGLIYPIPVEGEVVLSDILDIQSVPEVIENTADVRGFFTTGNTIDHTQCKVYALEYNISGLTGGTQITLTSFSGTTISGSTLSGSTSIDINEGDLLLMKVGSEYTGDLTHDTMENVPYLMYEIQNSTTGYTGNTLNIQVDRNLPNSNITTGTTSGVSYVYIYPSGVTYYDLSNPVAYWGDDYLNFNTSCSNVDDNVKIWNMNIVNIQDIIGIDNIQYKSAEDSEGFKYRGLYTYLKYSQSEVDKIGVIHYSNNTVSNYYGEGLLPTDFKLVLPTLMWHKKQSGVVGSADEIGYTFVCDTTIKSISNTVRYYDIVDQEEIPTTVGKMFPDLKIVVIEHPELLMAMSLKSNRNWTLPKPQLRLTEAGICPGSTSKGVIGKDEALHVTYLFTDDNNYLNGLHCEDYSTIAAEQTSDVLFTFPRLDNSQTYNEFPYFKNFKNLDGEGWSATDLKILMQRTQKDELPNPDEWKYFDATPYIGGDGCISNNITLDTDVELYKETIIVSNVDKTFYTLTHEPIGDIIVSVNGITQKEASSVSNIFYLDPSHPDYNTYKDSMGSYYLVNANNRVYFSLNSSFYDADTPKTALQVGDTVSFHYLKGVSGGSETIKQTVVTPDTITTGTSGTIYLDTPISTGVTISSPSPVMDLDTEPTGTVYVFYNGQVLSASNYFVVNNGGTYRVELNFTPPSGSKLILYYLSGNNVAVNNGEYIKGGDLNSTKIYLNHEIYNTIADTIYDVNDFISIPDGDSLGEFSFGDETYFFGNIESKIKATIYKSKIKVIVLPNLFINSNNPTFNSNLDTVGFTEIGIYDEDNDLVGIGKFSEPLTRENNSDVLVINVTIDI